MSELLPGFRDQLEARATTLAGLHERRARRGFGRRLHGRALGVAIVAGALTVGGVAYASGWLWSPQVGDPQSDSRATISRSPLPNDQRALLGVLRRAQTDKDRGAGTRAALRFQGGDMVGVRVDAVRLLGETAGGGAVVLIPTKRVDASRGQVPGQASKDSLCLWITDLVDGGGQTCKSLGAMRAGKLTIGLAGPPLEQLLRQKREAQRYQAELEAERIRRGETRQEQVDRINRESRQRMAEGHEPRIVRVDQSQLVGDFVQVVPDGVAKVRYQHQGKTITQPVTGNVVILHFDPWHNSSPAWLDADGHELQKGANFPMRKAP